MKTKDEVIDSLKKELEELDITSSLRLPIIQTIEYLQEEPQVKESAKTQHVKETCKENGNSLTQKSETIDFEQELYKYFGQVKDFTLGIRIAKRFYEIGKKHQESVSEDLEKEFDDIYYQLEKVDAQNDGFGGRYKGYKFALKIARHFANWQKQQMMKEAVDGTVFTQLEDGKIMVRSHYFKSEKIKYLDNVKLIIIKEEGYGKVK